jgi:hypothetical protein
MRARITIFGSKNDGSYWVEVRTAGGNLLLGLVVPNVRPPDRAYRAGLRHARSKVCGLWGISRGCVIKPLLKAAHQSGICRLIGESRGHYSLNPFHCPCVEVFSDAQTQGRGISLVRLQMGYAVDVLAGLYPLQPDHPHSRKMQGSMLWWLPARHTRPPDPKAVGRRGNQFPARRLYTSMRLAWWRLHGPTAANSCFARKHSRRRSPSKWPRSRRRSRLPVALPLSVCTTTASQLSNLPVPGGTGRSSGRRTGPVTPGSLR